MNIGELKQKRERQINGFFMLILEIVFIFGIPAIVAVILGKYLDVTGAKKYTALCLTIAFIFSWIIVVFLYRKKTKELAETEALIKKEEK